MHIRTDSVVKFFLKIVIPFVTFRHLSSQRVVHDKRKFAQGRRGGKTKMSCITQLIYT